MSVIRRDFLPEDVQNEIKAAGIDGVISVQARTSLAETRWLLEMAAKNEFIRGVVGWVPLTEPDLRDELAQLSDSAKLRGVREVCQGKPPGYMLRPEFLAGIGSLAEFGLVYDILIFEDQLSEAIQLVDQFSNQTFVLDHIAKPRIAKKSIQAWSEKIGDLAKRENVFCKLSGMVTEANWKSWTAEELLPYVQIVLKSFGTDRVLFGSDWPVCLVASSYGKWLETAQQFTSALSDSEQQQIFGKNASLAYGLNV